MHVPCAFRRSLPCNRYEYTYVKHFLGQWSRIQYEYIYVKKSPGIRNVFISARMVRISGAIPRTCPSFPEVWNPGCKFHPGFRKLISLGVIPAISCQRASCLGTHQKQTSLPHSKTRLVCRSRSNLQASSKMSSFSPEIYRARNQSRTTKTKSQNILLAAIPRPSKTWHT